MASLLKLKTDIKKLKAAIASKATSGAIKTKLRSKLTTLENELDKLQPNKRKPKTTGPKSESALVKLAKKRRTNQGLSTSKSDIDRDAVRPAKKAGKRISANGNRYYEYRDNRIDNRQPPKKYRKLADGGYMAKGGKTIVDSWDNLQQKVKEETLYSSGVFDRALAKKYSAQDLKSLPEEVKVKLYLSSGGQEKVKGMGYNEYLFNFVDGGWNSVWAKNEKQAIKSAKEEYENSKGQGVYARNVDENTFRLKTDSEYKRLMSEFYAKGGKTKDQEVVRGYFEDQAYEYADGGMVAKLKKEFASKDLDDDLMMDGYHVEIFDYKEEAEKDRFIKKNSKDNYLVPWDNDDDNYYIVVVPKETMADGGKTQGYDDKKDESLGMTRGKLSLKDFVGNRAQKEHARRDDARFEERGKMAKGGLLEHGLQRGDTIEFENLSDDGDIEVVNKFDGKFYSVNLNNGTRKEIVKKVPLYMMADGGSVAKGNYEMLLSQAKEVIHHAEELMKVAKPDMDVEAWVVAKAERATTDLSDITHYLDGLKMAMGGMVKHNAHKVNA